MTQEEIDAATASRVGHTMAEKGKSRRIMAELLVFSIQQSDQFFEMLPKLFPKLGAIKAKHADLSHHEHSEHCDCRVIEKEVKFEPRQAAQIQDLFRQNFPNQWPALNTAANDWVHSLMSGNLPTRDAPMSAAYWNMLTQGSKFAFDTVTADKNKPKGMPVIPFVVNGGEDFVKKIYVDGYTLVRSQVTLNVLPTVMDTMNKALASGMSWDEATQAVQKQSGLSAYQSERIVRSEMAMAANKGTVAGAKALNEPSAVIKWSTSMGGNACPRCLAKNGQLYELDSPEATKIEHPMCMCVKVVTFRKRERQIFVDSLPTDGGNPNQEEESIFKPRDTEYPIQPAGKGISEGGKGSGKASLSEPMSNHSYFLSEEKQKQILKRAKAKIKELGINDDIAINLYYSQNGGGHTTIPRRPSDPTLSINLGYHEKIDLERMLEITSHELKHVQQFNSGRLMSFPNSMIWEGEEYITNKEINRIFQDLRSPDEAIRQKAFKEYQSWPWEIEARKEEKK